MEYHRLRGHAVESLALVASFCPAFGRDPCRITVGAARSVSDDLRDRASEFDISGEVMRGIFGFGALRLSGFKNESIIFQQRHCAGRVTTTKRLVKGIHHPSGALRRDVETLIDGTPGNRFAR